MARNFLLVLLALGSACSGRAQRSARGGAPRAPRPAPVVSQATVTAETPIPSAQARGRSAPAEVPATIESLAPEPRIRVGLETSARGVRLTASRPFRVGAMGRFIQTQDVFVEPGPGAPSEGATFRVELASFLDTARARAYRAELIEEGESPEELTLRRLPRTGRYAVRLGSYAGESAARARLDALARDGHIGLGVVREPTTTSRPVSLLLHPAGQASVRLDALSVIAVPARSDAGIEVDGRPYRGYVEVFVNAASLFTVVNVVNLEDYLKGVVPAELSPETFPQIEAVKAQALAARTYAIKRSGQFASEGYDICATPACQVYRGMSVEHPMASRALQETRGEVLTYRGRLVDALYTSTCGGRTENSENVFSNPFPYLVSRACFLETAGDTVRSAAGTAPGSLEWATLRSLGIAFDSPQPPDAPVSAREAEAMLDRTLAVLGQSTCRERGAANAAVFDVVGLARLIGEGLCWERRLPFLLSDADARRIVPSPRVADGDARSLAFSLREGILTAPPDGLESGRPITRRDLHLAMYRLIEERGEPALRPGTILRLGQGRIVIRDDSLGDEDNEIVTGLAPGAYLFRATGEQAYFAPQLELLPGDEVGFVRGDRGLDVLVLRSEGASFDRSSRLSHWTVRRTAEDLTASVGRHDLGRVLELRPTRYGRSGRIIELSIVGTTRSVDLKGLAIRRALGIRENLFFLDAQRDEAGRVSAWVFTGRGWGHGVGLCQVGAFGMALSGFSYREILAHYYPGTQVTPSSGLAHLDVDNPRRAP